MRGSLERNVDKSACVKTVENYRACSPLRDSIRGGKRVVFATLARLLKQSAPRRSCPSAFGKGGGALREELLSVNKHGGSDGGEQARWVGWAVNDSKKADANSTTNPISRASGGERARWVGWVTVNKRGGEVGRTSRVVPLTKKPQAS